MSRLLAVQQLRAPLDNTQFMDTWETYLHCRSSTEPDEIRADLERLNRIAHAVTTENQPSVLVPAAIRSRFEALPSRLAVDPRSMASACALHGGRVAQSVGQPELSAELFTAAGATQEGSTYVSYAVEVNRKVKHREKESLPAEGWQVVNAAERCGWFCCKGR